MLKSAALDYALHEGYGAATPTPPPDPIPMPPDPTLHPPTVAEVKAIISKLTYNYRAGAGADEFAALDDAGIKRAGGRHVICKTRAQHDAAVKGIKAGDWIDCQGIKFTGTVNYAITLPGWAKLTFDSACSFTGATSQSQNEAIYMKAAQNVIFQLACDVTNKLGGTGVLVYRCNHMVFDVASGHSVHDCGGTGIGYLPAPITPSGDIQNFFLRADVHHVCQHLAYDPHTEKGPGIHCCITSDAYGGVMHHGLIALTGHDCGANNTTGGGSVLELGIDYSHKQFQAHDIDIYFTAERMLFKAKSMTAGNGFNAWGAIGPNVVVKACAVDNIMGHAICTDGSAATSKAGTSVLAGMATNYCQNPFEKAKGASPWMKGGGISYPTPKAMSPTP
jgi:hypothetical protein